RAGRSDHSQIILVGVGSRGFGTPLLPLSGRRGAVNVLNRKKIDYTKTREVLATVRLRDKGDAERIQQRFGLEEG
ncbi:MAG: hypothetical protein WBH85_02185, partial [Thermoanaerobaculia bacterium]